MPSRHTSREELSSSSESADYYQTSTTSSDNWCSLCRLHGFESRRYATNGRATDGELINELTLLRDTDRTAPTHGDRLPLPGTDPRAHTPQGSGMRPAGACTPRQCAPAAARSRLLGHVAALPVGGLAVLVGCGHARQSPSVTSSLAADCPVVSTVSPP